MRKLYTFVFGAVLLSPLVLVFFPEANRYELIRQVGPLLGLGILVSLFVVLTLWQGKGRFVSGTRFLWLLLACFSLWTLLSFIFAEVKTFGFAEVLMLFMGMLLVLSLAQERRLSIWLPWLSLGTLLLATGVGTYGFLTTEHARFFGFFYDPAIKADAWPNAYASLFLLVFPFALSALYGERVIFKSWGSLFRVMLLGAFLSGFVLTLSRGAFLAGIVEGLLGLFFLWSWGGKAWFHQFGKTVLVHGLLVILFAGIFTQGLLALKKEVVDLDSRLTFTEAEGGNSASERLQFFEGALRLIQEHPWFGTGPSSFRFEYPVVQQGFLALSDHPHNVLLKWAVERGTLAVVFFLLFLGLLFRYSYPRRHGSTVSVLAWTGLLGFMAHHMIDYNLNFATNALFFFFVLAGLVQGIPGSRGSSRLALFLTGTLLALLMVSGLRLFFDARRLNGSAVFVPLLPAWELYEKMGSTVGAERELWMLVHLQLNPKDSQIWTWYAELKAQEGNLDEARVAYEMALTVNPKNTFAGYLAYARLLQELGDEDALRALRVTLEPLFEEYQTLYDVNLHYTQSTSEKEWMEELKAVLF